MKKTLLIVIAAICLVGGIAWASGAKEAAAGPVKLTFSTASVPTDTHTKALDVFKEELEKLSGKTVTLDYFHSGQMFTQVNEHDGVMQGKVDFIYSSASWLSEHVPTASMFGSAFTFSSYEQMTKTLNGPIGKAIFDQAVAKLGIRPLGAWYLGTRQLNLTEKVGPVTKPEQMSKVKLRVPNAPAWIAMGKALGANPTPMSFNEVYMGLKTGVIDGQDNPLPTDKNAKFYEVTKYIVLTNHIVDSIWPTVNEKRWQGLTAQQKDWIMQALGKAKEFCDKTNLDNEKTLLDFFKSQGLTVIDNPDRAAFAAYAKNFYLTEGKDISKNWDMQVYDEVQKLR